MSDLIDQSVLEDALAQYRNQEQECIDLLNKLEAVYQQQKTEITNALLMSRGAAEAIEGLLNGFTAVTEATDEQQQED